ncbi:MAG TPA: hypothetical protein ENJ95_06105 [Bacteroidetes bacterium]|nr:hypothetical protein [Bacteroidota bacterium]
MKNKLFKIPIDETDSQGFVDIVNVISTSISKREELNEVSITKIKNWFDHKWLNYSGKAVVPFESGGLLPVNESLEPKWKSKITAPPFNPNRILWRRNYFISGQINGKFLNRLHRNQTSEWNLQNRMADKSDMGLYIWYSSNSKINKRGGLMIYRTGFGKITTWYASFEKRNNWKLMQTKGIEIGKLKGMLK